MKNQGGMSTHFAEHVKRYRTPFLDFDLYVDREVTLSESLREIESHYFRAVVLVLREGFDDEQQIRLTSFEDVAALRDALDKALYVTNEDKPLRGADR